MDLDSLQLGSCNTNYSFAQVQGQLGLESSGTNNDPQFTSLPYGSTMNSYLNDYSLGAGSLVSATGVNLSGFGVPVWIPTLPAPTKEASGA